MVFELIRAHAGIALSLRRRRAPPRRPRDPCRVPAGSPLTASNAPDDGGRAQVYLHAGPARRRDEPTAIATILGSCVSVCLWDPDAGVGGVNHFLLPFHVEREKSPRFGSVAIPRLVEEVVRAGADPRRLQAKVFGGASVIGAFSSGAPARRRQRGLALRLLERGAASR